MPDQTTTLNRLTMKSQQFAFRGDADRQRPTSVSGIVATYVTLAAVFPLAHYEAGDINQMNDTMEGCDKGHIVAASLSGVSVPENIVPMYPSFNQQGGIWKELENRITSYMKESYQPTKPRDVRMTVDIKYEGINDTRFPSAFEITVKDSTGHLYFKGAKLDKLRIAHLPTPAEQVDATVELGAAMAHTIRQAKTHVDNTGWKIEDEYPAHSPPIIATLGDVPSRPYAMLDYLWLKQNDQEIVDFLTGGTTYVHQFASQFHDRQKQLIRAVNRLYSGGYLKSDYPGDVPDNLIVGSGKRSAQVDHVHPYENTGPNLFSNAMIASGAFNNKARTMDAKDKWGLAPALNMPALDRHQ